MHVPAKNHRAESKSVGGDGEEFLLGDELAAELTVDINTGELDFVVVLQNLSDIFECYFGFAGGRHGACSLGREEGGQEGELRRWHEGEKERRRGSNVGKKSLSPLIARDSPCPESLKLPKDYEVHADVGGIGQLLDWEIFMRRVLLPKGMIGFKEFVASDAMRRASDGGRPVMLGCETKIWLV